MHVGGDDLPLMCHSNRGTSWSNGKCWPLETLIETVDKTTYQLRMHKFCQKTPHWWTCVCYPSPPKTTSHDRQRILAEKMCPRIICHPAIGMLARHGNIRVYVDDGVGLLSMSKYIRTCNPLYGVPTFMVFCSNEFFVW
jgi:hypothetical protein